MISAVTNKRGSALIITILVVAAVSIVATMSILGRGQGMNKIGGTYREHVLNAQIKHELAVIFASPALCKSVITLSGTNFNVATGFKTISDTGVTVLSTDKRFAISKMVLENSVDLGGGLKQADFAVYTKNVYDSIGTTTQRAALSAIYADNGAGSLTDCRVVIAPAKACSDLGITYSGSRCLICENLGGTWTGSACAVNL